MSYFFDDPLREAPWCNVCDDQILDDRCYVFDKNLPFESCVCKKCMDRELGKMVNHIAWFVRENLDNYVREDVGLSKTPAKESGVLLWEETWQK